MKLSLVVPCYNEAENISRFQDAVMSAFYECNYTYEIIFVDDGSTDGSSIICDELKAMDSRVLVIHKENGGLSDARNCGVKEAKGKYVCFVDSDDFVDKDFVKILYTNIVDKSCDIAICRYEKFFDYDKINFSNKENLKTEKLNNTQLINCLFKRGNIHFITACTKMYKKELFDNLEFDKGRLHEDEFIVHKIFSKLVVSFVSFIET